MKMTDSTSDLVKIASYLFIDKYFIAKGREPRGVEYNKFMTLLNHDLKSDHNTDIKLPHCWYRWGDEVVKYYVQPYTNWTHEDLGITAVGWKGDIPKIDLSNHHVRLISQYADSFISEYSDEEGVERAIDRLYSIAPYEFQNSYRKVRENLKATRSGQYFNAYHKNILLPLFESAMASFPEEFSKIRSEKVRFEAVFKEMIEEKYSPDDLREVSEEFWFFFCYHLRLDKKCHKNIGKNTLDIWRSSLPWETEMFDRNLQVYAYELKCKDDPVVKDLSELYVQRMSDIDALIDEFDFTDCEENGRHD